MKLLPNEIQDQENEIDLSKKAYLLDPSGLPLYTLITHLNYREALNPRIEWLDQTSSGIIPQFNYLQIFRKTIYPPKVVYSTLSADIGYERKKKTTELLKDIERCFFFGNRYSYISQGYRTSGGLSYFIKTHIATASSNIISEIEYMIPNLTNRLFIFAPSSIIREWNKKHIGGKIVPLNRTYRTPMIEYITSTAVCYFIPHPLLNSHVFFVSLDNLVYRYFVNRDVKMYKYSKYTGYHDLVIAECGLEIHDEHHHGMIEIV